MSVWKKTLNFALVFTILVGFIPGPNHIQTVRANPASKGSSVYLPIALAQLPAIIPASTNILSEESNQYLVSISGDSVQFVFSRTTSELDKVEPGDIIVSDVSPKAPSGYFRKVQTKTLVNGQVVLTTGPASFEEAIEQVSLSYQYTFSPADIVEASALPGVSFATLESGEANYELLNLEFNEVLLGGHLETSGSLTLDLSLVFDLAIRRFSLENLSLVLQATETTDLQLVSTKEAAGSEKYEFGRYKLRPISIVAGGFPIVVHPKLTLFLGADGTVSASLTAGMKQEARLSGGVQYVDGKLKPVKEFKHDFIYQAPSISAQMEARAYAEAGLELAFYTTSPLLPEFELDVRAGPKIYADQSLCWFLKGFLEADLEVELKLFKWELAEVKTPIINTEKTLFSSLKCTLLEINGNSHQFGALTNASAQDGSGTVLLYDYQEDLKQLSGDEAKIADVTLEAGVSAIAGGVASHTTSIGAITYETVTNTLGVPSILSGKITFDTSWNFNPNGVPYSIVSGLAKGYYLIYLTPQVDGKFVLTLSSEVNRSSAAGANDGFVIWQTGGGFDQYDIPLNGNEVITRSVTAHSTHVFHYSAHGVQYNVQSLASPLSGWGTAHTEFQWKFIPAGTP